MNAEEPPVEITVDKDEDGNEFIYYVKPGIYYSKYDSTTNTLDVELMGEVAWLINQELQHDGKLHTYIPYESSELRDCMKKNGLLYNESDPDNLGIIHKGYIVYNGNNDKEIYIDLASLKITHDYKINFIIRGVYFDDEEHIKEYVAPILKEHAVEIIEAIYKAFLSYMKGEICDEEKAAKKEAAAKKEKARNKERYITEKRKGVMKSLKGKTWKNKTKFAEYNYTNLGYNTNENAVNNKMLSKKLALKSRINMADVPYRFVIAAKSKEYEAAIPADELLDYSDVFSKIELPIASLTQKGFICKGISKSYVRESILKADIVIMLLQTTDKNADDSYIAGIAMLKIKDTAVEIDIICSQIAYGQAGTLLMNKIIEITKKLGRERLELLSVHQPKTRNFYTKKYHFRRVPVNNAFGKRGESAGLIPYRMRVTRKKPATGSPAASGAGAKA